WAEATRLMQDALSLDPQNGSQLEMAASSFYLPRGEFAEASRLYLAAGAISGPEDRWFGMRVRIRMAWRGEEAALRLVERTPPGKQGAEVLRAELLMRLGRLNEARAVVAALESPVAPPDSSKPRPRVTAPYYLETLNALGLADL